MNISHQGTNNIIGSYIKLKGNNGSNVSMRVAFQIRPDRQMV